MGRFPKEAVLVGGIPFFKKTLNSGPCQDACGLTPLPIQSQRRINASLFAKIDICHICEVVQCCFLRSYVENPMHLVSFAPDPFAPSWYPNLVSTDMLCRVYCHRVIIIYINWIWYWWHAMTYFFQWIPKNAPQAFLSMSSFNKPCIARCRSNKTCSPSSRRIKFCIICFTRGSKRVG